MDTASGNTIQQRSEVLVMGALLEAIIGLSDRFDPQVALSLYLAGEIVDRMVLVVPYQTLRPI